ncbi:hypothetical protein C8R45DRAFT_1028149 [Mycena sanguinolenta]|nr:hypothetical protein C8R45DRAFT_1028149 [Mycena sanguinolenta]
MPHLPQMVNKGNYIVILSRVATWLGSVAEAYPGDGGVQTDRKSDVRAAAEPGFDWQRRANDAEGEAVNLRLCDEFLRLLQFQHPFALFFELLCVSCKGVSRDAHLATHIYTFVSAPATDSGNQDELTPIFSTGFGKTWPCSCWLIALLFHRHRED